MNQIIRRPQPSFRFGWYPNIDDNKLEDPAMYDGIRFRRMVAFCIDWLMIGILFVIVLMVGSLFAVMTLGLLAGPLGLLLTLLPIIYHTWFIGSPGNATIGMRVMGIRVYSWDGHPPGYIQALVTTVVFYATLAPTSGLVLVVSLFNPQGRLLHDYLCGTLVARDSF